MTPAGRNYVNLLVTLLVVVAGCGVYRDDTTGATRQLVASHLGVGYDNVKADTTLGDLNCDELDVVEIIMLLEDSFDISISESEFSALVGEDGWQDVTILEMADLARSKRSF